MDSETTNRQMISSMSKPTSSLANQDGNNAQAQNAKKEEGMGPIKECKYSTR